MKKGQTIALSSMFVLFIFFLIVTLFSDFLFYNTSEDDLFFEKEATRITETLLQEGYPKNWDLTTVERIGLLSNNRLNETKLQMLVDLLNQKFGYQEIKRLIGIQHEYLLDIDGTIIHSELITNEAELTASDAKIIVTQQRILLNEQGEPITLKVYVYTQ